MTKQPDQAERGGGGTVLVYSARAHEPEHEKAVHFKLGEQIAGVLGMHFGGSYDADDRDSRTTYLIPTCTLIGADLGRRLRIRSTDDLYGGLAPADFISTKAITHSLLHDKAEAPLGWSHTFGRDVQGSVLAGITVFTLKDGHEAGERLLRQGPVRIKPVRARAGRGQQVVSDPVELRQALEAQDVKEITRYGLVLEENLDDVHTFSVGQVKIGNITASYVGTQCLTSDNDGDMVYGGSNLIVAQGDYSQLLALNLKPDFQTAIAKARVYDHAALQCFPGLIASRRNYDIASGVNHAGQVRCGVLEQSWRIGGASAAEIAAIQAFHADASLQSVQATTIELFGELAEPPAGAEILFSGIDPELGRISKYVRVRNDGH